MMRGISDLFAYILVCTRMAALIALALFLPRLGILYMQTRAQASVAQNNTQFKLGIECISNDFLRSLSPKNDLSFTVGLVTNQSGCDQRGQRTLDILLSKGVQIKKVFAPEHGLEGTIKDSCHVETEFVDEKTGIPVIMLHEKGKPRTLNKKLLEGIDILMFDIQEIGIRHNTYLTTLFQVIESAATHKRRLVVFDRPNIMGPLIEGPLVEEGFKSDISYASIPLRHGMTIGELASYFNNYCAKTKVDLQIVTMENYNRYQNPDKTVLTHLSPSIKSLSSCYGYSFLGMLGEVRPFDVALGTEKAFQCIAFPDSKKFPQKKWFELRDQLKGQGIEARFHRYFSNRRKQHCSGLCLYINNMNNVSSIKSLLLVLNFFKKSGVELQFSPSFDRAVGTKKVRSFLEGNICKSELDVAVNDYLQDFFSKASTVFKYRPHPHIMRL